VDKLKDAFVDEAFRLGDVGHGIDARDRPFDGSMVFGTLHGQDIRVHHAVEFMSQRLKVMALKGENVCPDLAMARLARQFLPAIITYFGKW
jgi:hypothetical protein